MLVFIEIGFWSSPRSLGVLLIPKVKKQEQAILKGRNSFRVLLCLNIAQLFYHISAGFDIRTNFFPFLNFGEIQTSSKKSFIALTTGESWKSSLIKKLTTCDKVHAKNFLSKKLNTSQPILKDFEEKEKERGINMHIIML